MSRYRGVLISAIILLSVLSPIGSMDDLSIFPDQEIVCDPTTPAFNISLMAPNSGASGHYSSLLEPEFPKSCIGISNFLMTDWTTIADRTWLNQDPTNPTHEDGGFDIFFVGYSSPKAPIVTLGDLYRSDQFPTDGGFNFIHFSNENFDQLHQQYIRTYDGQLRRSLAYAIQEVLYDEQPTITVLYGMSLFATNAGLNLSQSMVEAISTQSLGDGWSTIDSNSSGITYAHFYDITGYAPQVAETEISQIIVDSIWQGLYTIDPDTKLFVPELAGSMPTIADNKTSLIVEIRSDVNFADGHLMDIEDVIESFKRIMIPEANDHLQDDFIEVFGNSTITGGNISIDDMIIQLNETHIQFNIVEPNFHVLDLLSYPILPTHIYGTADSPNVTDYDFNSALLDSNGTDQFGFGTGPFQYKQIDTSTGNVTLVKNSNYWNGSALVDSLNFLFYPNKSEALSDFGISKVHILDGYQLFMEDFDGLIPSEGISFFSINDGSWQEIAINMDHPILGTGEQTPLGIEQPDRAAEAARYVRQAISHTIPRQMIIEEYWNGRASPGITAWGQQMQFFSEDLQPYEYNIQRAIELLQMAGYSDLQTIDLSTSSSGTSNSDSSLVNGREDTNPDTGIPPLFEVGSTLLDILMYSMIPLVLYYSLSKKRKIEI